ncbi:MAG TPA: response regulator transcription factor [Candidatus Acidoferrales bacterium]|jgi:two-component system invasion response regulator UvrY|nr:response regulator transcription factor [Candidatus Acidoferrales bacterium]
MMRVLIIDDHEMVRRGLKDIFNDEFSGLEIGEAGNSRAALELITKKDWDLILLDINIPGRNGLEVLGEIKRLNPRTPVLVVSAYPEEEFAIRALKLGASGYLNKNSASDEVVAAARKTMAGGKYVTALLAEKLAATLGGDLRHAPHESLSNRELQVLRMISLGRTIKEIAAELALSEKTVGTYRSRISQKMGLATNVELTRYALQHQLAD